MKKIITLFALIFTHLGFSQTTQTENAHFKIIIESLPNLSGEPVELTLLLENKGTYSFEISKELIIPQDYTLVVMDKNTGNKFDLQSAQNHSFRVNRTTTKQFVISCVKTESLTSVQKSLLNMLLL